MSGRQISNSLFTSKKGILCVYNNEQLKADQAWELIVDNYWGDKVFFEKLVTEIRTSYVSEYVQFLNKIEIPVILFYFSQREPTYSFNWEKKHVNSIWDKYPHLVDDTTIKEILAKSKAAYAKCMTKSGIPYILKDKTGKEKPLWIHEKKEFQ